MTQAFVIGPGEVGRRLSAALQEANWSTTLVSRTEGWDEAVASPKSPDDNDALRILAMREEDLVDAFNRFAPEQRKNLVLVQNGFLEIHLPEELTEVTRGLIWFTSKGDFYLPLRPSIFYGPRAEEIATALTQGGIECTATKDDDATREMILKGFWNTVVGLPLAVHNINLEAYLENHRPEIEELANEACAVSAAEYGVKVSPADALDCLDMTTTQLGWVATSKAKALDWRNGAVAAFGKKHGIATPVNDRLLAEE